MTHRPPPSPLPSLKKSLVAHAMILPDQTVGVALSGGPDSTALLALMSEIAPSLAINLVAFHFDHRYRPDSADDATFAQEIAGRLGVPCIVGENPDPKPPTGLMAEARRVRYRFFDQMIAEGVADRIALAHTKDDVAESALIRLLRGGGPGAFGGPRPVRGPYIRPLLDVTKSELIAYLDKRDIPWRDDPTNRNQSYLRNRVRSVILPALVAEEPTAVDAIARLARQVAAQDEVIVALAEEYLHRRGGETLTRASFPDEPTALRQAIIRRLARAAGCDVPLSAQRVEEIDRLVCGDTSGATVEVGGGFVARIDQTTLTFVPALLPPIPAATPFAESLAMRWGERELVVGGDDGDEVAMGRIPVGATFRCRRSGDTVNLPAGSRSLKRYLIDRKVPASTRDRLPLLADGSTILWIPAVHLDPTLSPTGDEPTLRIAFRTPG